MRRNQSIGTTSVHIRISIIWHAKNKFQIIWHVNNKELRTLHISYANSYKKCINLSYDKLELKERGRQPEGGE
jgi:hypothetical protein